MDQAEANAGVPVNEVLGDGAYDSARIYDRLRAKGIDVIIKPRKNSILNTGSEEKGYGRRWSVETAHSTFKRAFGESVMAKTMANAARELAAKAAIYNMLVRT